MDAVYLGFQRAFDEGMRVRVHAVSGKMLAWIEGWLNYRRQSVYKVSFSGWQSVTSDVPHGPVFGPLLFTLYINDLCEEIKSFVAKFADD